MIIRGQNFSRWTIKEAAALVIETNASVVDHIINILASRTPIPLTGSRIVIHEISGHQPAALLAEIQAEDRDGEHFVLVGNPTGSRYTSQTIL